MVSFVIVGLVVLIALLLVSSLKTVRPTQRGLIERFGKYSRFANPGLNFVIPLIESMRKVNVTEHLVTAEPQQIITEDRLNAVVDAQVYYKVKDDEKSVKNSMYNVDRVDDQIVALARTTLRNIIGTMKLTEANSERGRINKALQETLEKETANWGISIVRTELKEIDPPKDVQETMNSVVIAENQKKAALDFATAAETEADGKRRAAIKAAEGESAAIKIKAQGNAEAVKVFNEAVQKYFVGNARIYKQLEVTQASLEHNSKIIVTEKGISPVIILGPERVIPLPQDRNKR